MWTYNIGKSTISDIKKSEPQLRQFSASKEQLGIKNAAQKAKSMKSSDHEELNQALYIWFRQLREKNVQISGPILRKKIRL